MTSIPINKQLYSRVKFQAKKKFKVWPSAYASGWLVKKYKKLGGKYRKSPRKSRKRRSKSPRKSRKRRSKSPRKSRKRRSKSPRKSRKRRSKSPMKSRKRRSKSPRKSRKRRSKSPRKSRKRRSKSPRKSRMGFSRKRHSKNKHVTGLSRWFAEEWIDVCQLPRIVPCGRKSSKKSNRKYPYCRPRYRITSKSPIKYSSLSPSEIKKRCNQKRKSPYKKVR
jgi:hypothetical protein